MFYLEIVHNNIFTSISHKLLILFLLCSVYKDSSLDFCRRPLIFTIVYKKDSRRPLIFTF